jgi:hypothetical protein
MADFSLNTLFVVPVGKAIASSGSTQDLDAGEVGFFNADYTVIAPGDPATGNYFYVAQGRLNTYLQGTKRSDKIAGCPTGSSCRSNVTEFYKISGCPTPVTQVTDVENWNVRCGDVVTLTLRGHSSYLDTLYFNGFTRSVTVQAPCCDCGGDPCDTVDVNALIDQFIAKLTANDAKMDQAIGDKVAIELSKYFYDEIFFHGKQIMHVTVLATSFRPTTHICFLYG